MARKNVTVSLRKPPPAESLSLASDEMPMGLAPEGAPRASWIAPRTPHFWGEQVAGNEGHLLHECTLHLDVELARKLAVRCIEEDRNPNRFVADAVAMALGREREPVGIAVKCARAIVRMAREWSPTVAAVLDA